MTMMTDREFEEQVGWVKTAREELKRLQEENARLKAENKELKEDHKAFLRATVSLFSHRLQLRDRD